jgi:hypothetical protein
MIKKMNNLMKGRSYSLLGDIMVIPQEALHEVFGKIWKLRVMMVILVSVCIALGTVSLKGQEALSRLLHLETENKEKDATIEKLQEENKLLEEKLAFKRKVDALVGKIQKEAAWLDKKIIRPAVEMALAYTTDPALYLAIGLVEAGFRANVVHPDGVALGMHGLCPKDWHSYLKAKGIMENRDDYFDPVKSFKGSEAVLSALLREYGTLEKALLYYNGGWPAVAGKIPISKVYAKRVLRLREVFAAQLIGHHENEIEAALHQEGEGGGGHQIQSSRSGGQGGFRG